MDEIEIVRTLHYAWHGKRRVSATLWSVLSAPFAIIARESKCIYIQFHSGRCLYYKMMSPITPRTYRTTRISRLHMKYVFVCAENKYENHFDVVNIGWESI